MNDRSGVIDDARLFRPGGEEDSVSTNSRDASSAMDRRWLGEQLLDSASTLGRFLASVPLDRVSSAPPAWSGFAPLGEWSAHRHVFHLVYYERYYALPALWAAVDAESPPAPPHPNEDGSYDRTTPIEPLFHDFLNLRRQQVDILGRADPSALSAMARPWGQSVLWSVAKTIQHTLEHANDIARIALFWDSLAERTDKAGDHPFIEVARQWLTALQECVRSVDFEKARPLFADNVVSFGTHAALVSGRDALESEQWRHVWPHIREFTFRLDDVHCVGGDKGVVVIAPWDSLGIAPDGTTFSRPGRATIVLTYRSGRWVAAHTHFSLSPRS